MTTKVTTPVLDVNTSDIPDHYIGTTAIDFNRASASQTLNGVSIDGTAAKATNIVGGNNSTLLGSIPYQSNTDTTTLLSPNTSITKNFLSQTGSGTNGAAPVWSPVTATDVGLGNVTNESKTTMFTSPTFTGTVTLPTNVEIITPLTGATGTVTHDLATSNLFYHSSISASFVADITNVPTTNNRSIGVTIVLSQSSTPYTISGIKINSGASNETIKWQDNITPVGTSNKTDAYFFTLIRVSDTWTVIGSLATFG